MEGKKEKRKEGTCRLGSCSSAAVFESRERPPGALAVAVFSSSYFLPPPPLLKLPCWKKPTWALQGEGGAGGCDGGGGYRIVSASERTAEERKWRDELEGASFSPDKKIWGKGKERWLVCSMPSCER